MDLSHAASVTTVIGLLVVIVQAVVELTKGHKRYLDPSLIDAIQRTGIAESAFNEMTPELKSQYLKAHTDLSERLIERVAGPEAQQASQLPLLMGGGLIALGMTLGVIHLIFDNPKPSPIPAVPNPSLSSTVVPNTSASPSPFQIPMLWKAVAGPSGVKNSLTLASLNMTFLPFKIPPGDSLFLQVSPDKTFNYVPFEKQEVNDSSLSGTLTDDIQAQFGTPNFVRVVVRDSSDKVVASSPFALIYDYRHTF